MSHRCGASGYGDGADRGVRLSRIAVVVTAFSGFPDGATVEEIEQVLMPRQTRRNVDYALSVLVELARIVKESGSGTDRYRMARRLALRAKPLSPLSDHRIVRSPLIHIGRRFEAATCAYHLPESLMIRRCVLKSTQVSP